MKMLSCVNLNSDFGLGGVTRGLAVFDHPSLCRFVHSRVLPVDLKRMFAPRLREDVIVNHVTPNWASLPFLFMLRLRNSHAWMVHVEHSYTRGWERGNVRNKSRFRTMLKLAYAEFDEIVAVSQAQRDWLIEIGAASASKVRVINPWSGANGLDRLPDPQFASGKPLRLGAIGRFAKVKGFDTLVRAMGRLSHDRFELLLGGFGPEQADLMRLAEGQPNVRFAGKVDDVAGFFARCDAIVVPSRWEAFGQVAAEARLAGRPVLVADVDGLPEQAVSGGMVADCSTPEALALAISEFAQADLCALGRHARRSMAGAEYSRINGWMALFVNASRKLGERQVPRPARMDLTTT